MARTPYRPDLTNPFGTRHEAGTRRGAWRSLDNKPAPHRKLAIALFILAALILVGLPLTFYIVKQLG